VVQDEQGAVVDREPAERTVEGIGVAGSVGQRPVG
jgi:hypothetical protein